MTVLGRFEVLPLNAQVDIRDPEAKEYPQWETGEERAIATEQCVAVATRSDADGRVAVEVRSGSAELPLGALTVFDGEISLTGKVLVVGNYLASEAHQVSVSPGWHRLTVYVRPVDFPAAEVIVVLDMEIESDGE